MATTFPNAIIVVANGIEIPFLQQLPDFQEQAEKIYYQTIESLLGSHR